MVKECKQRKAEAIEFRRQHPWSEEELLRMALRDPLTGLLNRRAFEEELREIWSRARPDELPVGLLMVDIDHFKAMNDTYGHAVGDLVLKECARLVRTCVRETDILCRYYGGDEFVVILPRSNEADIRQAAERLLEAFRTTALCPGVFDIQATISIGANRVKVGAGQTLEQLLIDADRALYRAKQTGRNRACFASEAPAAPEAALLSVQPGAVHTARTVLVVDDDEDVCRLFERMLTRHDFAVLTACNGGAALEIARRERGLVDVALVDLRLAGESGLDVLKNLHAIDDAIIGVIITSFATLDDAVLALRQGAYDFVQKPVAAD